MIRRLWFRGALVLVAMLALAATAYAGGVVVSLDGSPGDVEAGKPFDVSFTIRSAHDGSKMTQMTPEVKLINAVTGEAVTAIAKPGSGAGQYVATLTLPSEGEWGLQIQPFGKEVFDYPASEFTPILAHAPAAAAPAAQPASAATWALPAVLWSSLAIALIVGGMWIGTRRRLAAQK